MNRQLLRLMRFDPRTALKVFAILVFAGLSGLAIATLLVSRGPIPAEVTGSPTPPEYASRSVSGVVDVGDFITRAPDGEAYVQIRYEGPEAFRQLIHTYRIAVLPQNRINTAALQTSDDGANWTGVAEAEGQNGYFAFDLRDAGAHKFWKMSVVRSGDAPEVVFGQLLFYKNDSIFQRVPVDAVWLGFLPASILIFLAFRIPLSLGRVFTATALPVALFVLAYSLGYVDFHTVTTFDSFSYLGPLLGGSFSSTRSAGYPIILIAANKTVGLDHLAWVQLGAGIACYLAGAYLLAVRFGNKWIGSVLALAFLIQGTTLQFASEVMTEALFTAGLGLFAAALGALAWRPDRLAVVAAIVGIILATLTKAVGIALVVPALLLIRFLPRGKRLSVSGAIVISGLATYGLLAINNFVRTGALSPESYAGYSLIGHVGGMLDDELMPPSDLTRRLIGAVAPVLEQRPADLTNIRSLATLDRYVDVTLQDYNTLAWTKLIPIATAELHSIEKVNAFLLRFGISSIRAHPGPYLRHVAAHFYGIWRDLGGAMPLGLGTLFVRQEPILYGNPQVLAARNTIPASVLRPYPNEAVLRGEVVRQSNLPLMLGEMWDSALILRSGPLGLGVLALFLCILFLIPGRLAYTYRTEIMIALSLNAYFAAHVLVQVSTQRYAAVGTLAAIFLAASFVFTSFYALNSLRKSAR